MATNGLEAHAAGAPLGVQLGLWRRISSLLAPDASIALGFVFEQIQSLPPTALLSYADAIALDLKSSRFKKVAGQQREADQAMGYLSAHLLSHPPPASLTAQDVVHHIMALFYQSIDERLSPCERKYGLDAVKRALLSLDKIIYGYVYDGEIRDGLPHGRGVYKYANGSVYDGEWKDGERHGRGVYRFENGDVYDGEWENRKQHGRGKMTFASGRIYDGQWKDGKKHGRGKMTFAGGNVYDGEWKDGKFHGRGKKTFASGRVYEGEWREGRQHGRGKMTYANGNVYNGAWEDGMPNGQGFCRYANRGVYCGEWENGKRHGRGNMTCFNGHYDGEWKEGTMHGRGQMTYASGHVYEGEWVGGKMHGRGKLTTVDGDAEEGSWRENKRYGEFTWKGAAGPSRRRFYHNGNLLSDEPMGVWTASLDLNEEHTTCQICFEEFSSDLNAVDERSRRQLPVVSTCNHFCCHRCILEAQAAHAENGGEVPERISCMSCREEGAFCPSEPRYYTLLISLLERKTFSASG